MEIWVGAVLILLGVLGWLWYRRIGYGASGQGLSLVLIFAEEEEVAEGVVRGWHLLARSWPGPWEMICVDRDSRDGTGAILERLSRSLPGVRFLRWKEGLSSSPLEAAYFAAAYPLVLFVERRREWRKAGRLPTFLVGKDV